MADVAKEIYLHRSYRYDSDLARKERSANLDVALNYAEYLCRNGKLTEALEVYENCSRSAEVPVERLQYLANSVLEAVLSASPTFPQKPPPDDYVCAVCDGVLVQPTTIFCGHTYCRRCIENDNPRLCRRCGSHYETIELETDIVIQFLVEKLWPAELKSAQLREEGNELMDKDDIHAAVAKYDQALALVPDNHLALSNRSQALCRMGRTESALADADLLVKLKPHWGKSYYCRGAALLAMSHFEAALTSFCICVALDRYSQAVRHDLTQVLQLLLSKQRRQRLKNKNSPFSTPSTKSLLRRARYFHCPPLSSTGSDGEQSSGEEDFMPSTRINLHLLLRSAIEELERLKYVEVRQKKELGIDRERIQKSDFDCVLCCRTLWKPVTTQCGHSYCLVCFERCLDYSSSCPLCVKSLAEYLEMAPKIVNQFLENCIRLLFPEELITRQLLYAAEMADLVVSPQDKNPKVPVFVCTTAFPGVHCPLFIYEPRYRLMVRRCAEAGIRQFGIAACLIANGARRYADYGTMLEIRDCVLLSDGCSILSTMGTRRFRTCSRGERDGYDTAIVEFITDVPICPSSLPAVEELHERVYNSARLWVQSLSSESLEQIYMSFGMMPALEVDWATREDGPSWAWWLLSILPLGPHLQISILGTTSLDKRLRAIEKTLYHISFKGPLPLDSSQRTCSESS